MSEMFALACWVTAMALFVLGLTLLNFKLYTEFAKQRMQENRATPNPNQAGEERK